MHLCGLRAVGHHGFGVHWCLMVFGGEFVVLDGVWETLCPRRGRFLLLWAQTTPSPHPLSPIVSLGVRQRPVARFLGRPCQDHLFSFSLRRREFLLLVSGGDSDVPGVKISLLFHFRGMDREAWRV